MSPVNYKSNGNSVEFECLSYMSGFGNHLSSEALPGALPSNQNNPRVCPYGLYAEQISGTAFTAPRALNQRSWMYRIKPSVTHEPFKLYSPSTGSNLVSDFSPTNAICTPNQIRWIPKHIPEEEHDFLSGLFTFCGTGSPSLKTGYAFHIYTANSSMKNKAFCNADGDLLFVPQTGRLWITTEFGRLQVSPGEISVVQQGIRFSVDLPDGPSRGYVCEIFGSHFHLPELGPIGANGLANPRDFVSPEAYFDDADYENFVVIQKFGGSLFEAKQNFSPFNVVAWHGNYVPYKYDLSKFCPMNAVLFDHPDPSIFTVLTCPSSLPGVALIDFVLFPPRWTVSENTFRPPYFHRNCMNEFMGLIKGEYEGKAEGFLPGGASLHCCMTPHGPDTLTFEKAVGGTENLPHRLFDSTLAFMFESYFTPLVTHTAFSSPDVDLDYYKCWLGLKPHFDVQNKPELQAEMMPSKPRSSVQHAEKEKQVS